MIRSVLGMVFHGSGYAAALLASQAFSADSAPNSERDGRGQ
jgi:hypothetical protein